MHAYVHNDTVYTRMYMCIISYYEPTVSMYVCVHVHMCFNFHNKFC